MPHRPLLCCLALLTACGTSSTTDAGMGMDAGPMDAGRPDAGRVDAGPPPPRSDAGAPCDDFILNGAETAVDCGGPDCEPCADRHPCLEDRDCESGRCVDDACAESTCDDGIRNGTEGDVDCGADCPQRCLGGQTCTLHVQCLSERCDEGVCDPSHCENTERDGDETGTNCGGSRCPPCPVNTPCVTSADCVDRVCRAGFCLAPECDDCVQNGDETGPDCGGPSCLPCLGPGGGGGGSACIMDTDCSIGSRCMCGGCVGCADRIRNADETDVDCGGAFCGPCEVGETCLLDRDCVSGRCDTAARQCLAAP